MKLHLWMSAPGAEDMDVFVVLQKLAAHGSPVGFTFYAFRDHGPVALGWLRATHRELDTTRSTAWQPVALDIEIWPAATLLRAGETPRVVVQGIDVYTESPPRLPFARHTDLRNAGRHVIHTGGEHDSHLLVSWVD